jgi:hypothetical protein
MVVPHPIPLSHAHCPALPDPSDLPYTSPSSTQSIRAATCGSVNPSPPSLSSMPTGSHVVKAARCLDIIREPNKPRPFSLVGHLAPPPRWRNDCFGDNGNGSMVVVARGLRLVENVGSEIEHMLACVIWSGNFGIRGKQPTKTFL